MSEQSNNNSGGNRPQGQPSQGGNNNNRRHNNRRRHNNNRPQGQGNAEPRNNQPRPHQGQQAQAQQGPRQPNQGNNQNNNQRRRPQHNNNRPRPQGAGNQQQGGGAFNIERVYEKYLNLLDQHIIARRKYHDLFYRADPAQKAKLERNFYNTLNDVREFENKLAPDVKVLFEKRNNGLSNDRTYTSNHELPIEGDEVPGDLPPAEPHYLQSQKAADYSNDTEESVGTAEDYLKYKGL